MALLAGVGLTVFVAGLLHPEIPLLALAAYVPFNKVLPGDFGGALMAFNLTNLFMAIAIIGYVLRQLVARRPMLEKSGLNLAVLLFCALGAASLIRGVVAGYGEEYAATFLIPLKRWLTPIVLFFLAFHLIRDRRSIQQMIVVMLIVVTAAALMAIKDYIDVGPNSSLEKTRVGGIAMQPNMLGAFFVYYMFLFAAFWVDRLKKFRYWGLLVPFLLCFRAIQVTFSRGAYIAFAAGALAMTFFKNKIACVILICLGVFAFMNPWLLPRGIAYRFSSTMRNVQINDVYESSDLVNNLDSSSYSRLQIWAGAVQMIREYPLFGVGYGVFPYFIGRYVTARKQMDAHNSYLIIAAEMGIPALLVFLWILGALFMKTRWLYRHAKDPFFKSMALGWLGGLSGLMVANMFGSRLHSEEISSYFWILCGIILRAVAIEREHRVRISS
ncbi:MAG: O-antigen ligase family protein [Candidatus Omnitrophica bacterium]|nr:O-antigen ligase family protein [Candidatus Omnitrophota bacterium]